LKLEAAKELGITIPDDGYWGFHTSRDCGRMGGAVGGRIGGQMVKRLISIAQDKIAEEN